MDFLERWVKSLRAVLFFSLVVGLGVVAPPILVSFWYTSGHVIPAAVSLCLWAIIVVTTCIAALDILD